MSTILPAKIKELVEKFNRHKESYKSSTYNETQLRIEFLDPLFEALGWDIDNKQGIAEAYKDVIHEDAIKIGGLTKAPDYCFRIGGKRKFFLEAKKPSVNLKDDPNPAFQLRRYAWSAKLPISILSDFEEFVIYDTRNRPFISDNSTKHRVTYYKYTDFVEKWEEIASVFSRDSVLNGAFDKYAEKTVSKKGTSEVDDEFLKEIEKWREMLAKDLAVNNTELSQRELNYTVQKTIDRIIFLRICEDRAIEDYGRLLALKGRSNIYTLLCDIFREADHKYNSGLFHFKSEKTINESIDTLTLNLNISDTTLKTIINNLYYPVSPYEFSVLPADTLGQVYEQFLGKVIRLTDSHRAVIEDKPEVKKAGGVYYTPTYIVDYIVKNTVGKILNGKTPKQVEKITILDPACGSGTFLLQAYQYLIDWHRDYYTKNLIDKYTKGKNPVIYQISSGDWRLTTAEKRKILINNIYGVDIDAQAVEVTKLSLLLKVLEGENQETLDKQLKIFHERALPDLGKNIKCGNSLIGSDFYEQSQTGLFDAEEQYKINAFDWNIEFKEIMDNGGFDTVIGNPPYLNIDDTWGKKDRKLVYIKSRYQNIYTDKTDIYYYFLTKSVAELSKKYTGFIVSRAFLEAYKAKNLRNFLASSKSLEELVDFRNAYIFKNVGITTCITIFNKQYESRITDIFQFRSKILKPEELISKDSFIKISIQVNSLNSQSWIFADFITKKINRKIDSQGEHLGEILTIGQGMQTGENNIFGKKTINQINDWKLNNSYYYKRATNSAIQRWRITDQGEYLLYLEMVGDFKSLPMKVQEYLNQNQPELKQRAAFKRGNCLWWKYTWPLHKEYYDRKRIICPYLATFNRFAIDTDNIYLGLTDTTVLFDNHQPENIFYILGLLNSKLLDFRYKYIGKLKGNNIYEYFWNQISKLTIKRINFRDRDMKNMHDDIVKNVQNIIELYKKMQNATLQHDKDLNSRQILSTENQINQIVYKLYNMTPSEIKIVEGDQNR